MAKVCEICGRIEETDEHTIQSAFDIVDVCPECTEHLLHTPPDIEG